MGHQNVTFATKLQISGAQWIHLNIKRRTYLHELRFDHGGGLVVVRVARTQQGVDLVDEYDAGLEMKFNRKHLCQKNYLLSKLPQ